jgi:regulator of replication initiation timing
MSDAQNTDVINPALADLSARLGDLMVTNALLTAENRALLARLAELMPADEPREATAEPAGAED